jgi:hypothetical protein
MKHCGGTDAAWAQSTKRPTTETTKHAVFSSAAETVPKAVEAWQAVKLNPLDHGFCTVRLKAQWLLW